MNESPLLSILIVTWNRKTELARSISSALAQTYAPKEIVVVDNGSSDGTAEMVRGTFPSIRLVQSKQNLGCPSGRNFGFRHCRGEYIYMLDDDGWLKEDAVEIAVRRAEADPAIGVVMSRIHEIDGDQLLKKRPHDGDVPAYQSSFSGGCSMIRRAALESAGAFPDDFFRQAEESDLALRMLEHGFFCFLEPASIMYHAPSPAGRNDKQVAYYNLRNTNKTGLRLWPFPWCMLRPVVNLGHAIRLMIRMRYAALPVQVITSLTQDLLDLSRTRRPVSHRTYSLFRLLQKSPSAVNPLLSS
jgi:GT2 family glycosyltransferase